MSVEERSTYFDDKALAAMIVAYDPTCRALERSGLTMSDRNMIGSWVVEAAKYGQRDPEVMHQQALNLWASKKRPMYLQSRSHGPSSDLTLRVSAPDKQITEGSSK